MKGRGQSPPTVAPRAKRLGPSVARGRAEGGARSEGGTTPKGAKGRVYLITRERKCKTPSLLIIYYLFFYPPHLLGFIDGVAIEGALAPERGRAERARASGVVCAYVCVCASREVNRLEC